MKKIISILLCAVLFCTAFAGCGKKKNNSSQASEADSNVSEADSDLSSEAPPQKVAKNFLTGEVLTNTESLGKRPVAVMINNIVNALPQYGISDADIMFEIPVEGGITRMMAVYSDFQAMPLICSIRSCRYYYPLIALGMDAVYVHWGQDGSIAKDTLLRTKIDRFEGSTIGAKYYGRDQARLKAHYSLEHTGIFDGRRMAEAMNEMKYRQDRQPSFGDTLFKFNDTSVAEGNDCTNAVVKFSYSYFSTFTYDAATNTYKKQHSGKPHMDQSTGKQLEFTNVLVLQTNIANRNNSVLMDVELKGGSGKYISAGKVRDITWKKETENSPIVIMDTQGKEISLNPGKSYIAFIGKEKPIALS